MKAREKGSGRPRKGSQETVKRRDGSEKAVRSQFVVRLVPAL